MAVSHVVVGSHALCCPKFGKPGGPRSDPVNHRFSFTEDHCKDCKKYFDCMWRIRQGTSSGSSHSFPLIVK
jgi:hypothetical protein